jgi:hypothetical protein
MIRLYARQLSHSSSFKRQGLPCRPRFVLWLPASHLILTIPPALGEKLVARGEVLSAGRRLFVCRAEVFAVSTEGEETPCAVLQQTIATTSG